MELQVTNEDRMFFRLNLSGKLDVEGESQIGDQLRGLLETHQKNFLIDMSKVTFLASLGIRLLFMGAKTLAVSGHKMIVLNPQPMVEETILTSGTARMIPIARDEAEASTLL
jgi:anti-sigma B factor antagonist